MKQYLARFGMAMVLGVSAMSVAAGQGQPNTARPEGIAVPDSVAKRQLLGYVTALRDSLYPVGAIQNRIQRARVEKSNAVVISLGHDLGRKCLSGAAIVELTIQRVKSGFVPTAESEQALRGYGNGLTALHESLRLCAHFDSLTMAARPLDEERLENIATAASDAIEHYDGIRDAFLKLLGLTMPVSGTIWH